MQSSPVKNLVYALTVLAVCVLQTAPARAGLVSTDAVLEQAGIISTARSDVISMLDVRTVQDELIAMGVDPAHVKQRVASLTDAELLELKHNLQDLPAGGISVVGAAVFVFLVLLATDIAGLTDIFPFVVKK